jgi:hypothetical protein
MTPDLLVIAIHEAGHSVVLYRVVGFADNVSVIAREGILGTATDIGCTDSWSDEHMEARVVSIYAGGCAQRRAAPRTGTDGCDSDENEAADLLQCYGWQSREASPTNWRANTRSTTRRSNSLPTRPPDTGNLSSAASTPT